MIRLHVRWFLILVIPLSQQFGVSATNAGAQWWLRAGGSANSCGGYDATISGAGTNYADQDAAQVTFSLGNSNRLNAAQNSITVTSDGAPFTSAMVGNCIQITGGTNFIKGYYWAVTYNSTSSIDVDRFPATAGAGSVGTGALGGAFATFANLCTSGTATCNHATTPSQLGAGNTVNVRGGSTDDPAVASADYDFTGGYWTFPAGDTTNGYIKFVGYNGRPEFKYMGLLDYNADYHHWTNFKVAMTTTVYSTYGAFSAGIGAMFTNGIVDQYGQDATQWNGTSQGYAGTLLQDVEFRNTGSTAVGTLPVVYLQGNGSRIENIWIHTARGPGLKLNINAVGTVARNLLITSGAADGIQVTTTSGVNAWLIDGCTIDANAGDGINIATANLLTTGTVRNCILSNQSVAGKYGLNVAAGTTAVNDRLAQGKFDYNNFYGNTAAYNNISAGTHDLALNPQYTATGSNNYQVGTNMKAVGFPGLYRGSGTTSYVDMGAAQRQEAAAGGGASGGGFVF